jgi:hypothetical protein
MRKNHNKVALLHSKDSVDGIFRLYDNLLPKKLYSMKAVATNQ